MTFINHTFIFIKNYMKQLQRKLFILPLFLLFPLIVIGGVAFLLVTFFSSTTESTIHLGVVNEDGSKETNIIVEVLEGTEQFGSFIEVESLERKQAEQKVYADEMSAYIVLPAGFTDDLYRGSSVQMDIFGNPQKEVDSQVVYQLVNSFMRHIRTSQANILLVNEYGKELPITDEERSDLVFDEFIKTFINIASKDKIVTEHTVENKSTSSPVQFFIISLFYITVTIWLFIFYHLLYEEDEQRMVDRMALYGVTNLQRMTSRIIVTYTFTMVWAVGMAYVLLRMFSFDIIGENIGRLAILLCLYSFVYLMVLAFLELVIKSSSIRLLTHVIFTGLFILLSGAVVPAIYFPLYIQDLIAYIPSYEALFWSQEIMLNGRFFAEYKVLIISTISMVLIVILTSLWKERVR
ncbi:MAG TPA: ABC transporter permease [Bacillota bacterium]|nr:ABC transporter permease [Bacillota bacterium]